MCEEKAEGYAVIGDSGIDVLTVSTTRRAAIVNWLVVNTRISIVNNTTDEQIERLWNEHSGGATVVTVDIRRRFGNAPRPRGPRHD